MRRKRDHVGGSMAGGLRARVDEVPVAIQPVVHPYILLLAGVGDRGLPVDHLAHAIRVVGLNDEPARRASELLTVRAQLERVNVQGLHLEVLADRLDAGIDGIKRCNGRQALAVEHLLNGHELKFRLLGLGLRRGVDQEYLVGIIGPVRLANALLGIPGLGLPIPSGLGLLPTGAGPEREELPDADRVLGDQLVRLIILAQAYNIPRRVHTLNTAADHAGRAVVEGRPQG